jgi:hypothetical protein
MPSNYRPAKFVRSMADYHSIIARAVSTLHPNTGEARRRLYGRARATVLAEMRRAYPLLDQCDIMAARKSLEEAIANVEMQARRAHQEPTDALSPPSSYQQRERIAARPAFGATMADYYSLVAKAINAVGADTEGARRRVYDRARAALLSEVHKLVPALDGSEVMAEQLYLELAIGEVEAQREQSAQSTVSTPARIFPSGVVVAAPSPPASQNDEQGRGARTERLSATERIGGRPRSAGHLGNNRRCSC